MTYTNGFAIDDFLQYMYKEFPTVYSNEHSRCLLQNTVDFIVYNNDTESGLLDLVNLIPEVECSEIIEFVDINQLRNNFITSFVDAMIRSDNGVSITTLEKLLNKVPSNELCRAISSENKDLVADYVGDTIDMGYGNNLSDNLISFYQDILAERKELNEVQDLLDEKDCIYEILIYKTEEDFKKDNYIQYNVLSDEIEALKELEELCHSNKYFGGSILNQKTGESSDYVYRSWGKNLEPKPVVNNDDIELDK